MFLEEAQARIYLSENQASCFSRPLNKDNLEAPSEREVLQMAAEIADGMAYLASRKILHRCFRNQLQYMELDMHFIYINMRLDMQKISTEIWPLETAWLLATILLKLETWV